SVNHPSDTEPRTWEVKDLNSRFNVDRGLQALYGDHSGSPLADVSTRIDISKGQGQITLPGVEISDGDLAQMCIVSPGWICAADLEIRDRRTRKTLIRKEYDISFFPAAQNQKSLINSSWTVLRHQQA
ncbi:hypothetical protein DFQ26_002173, partial [Actinomortierella ambigua]